MNTGATSLSFPSHADEFCVITLSEPRSVGADDKCEHTDGWGGERGRHGPTR